MGMLSVSTWHVVDRVCVCVYRWTHCLLSRLGSLVWQGSDRSRIGWNSSPCALQMLVKWRVGHTHAHARNAPWSSQTVGRSTYSTLKHTNNHNTIYTHTFLICFNVHFLHQPLLHLKHTQKQNRPILNRFIGYNDTKLSIILHTNTQTFPVYTCTC